MATQTMTIKEVLIKVHQDLGNINVPVAQIDQIGVPIAQALNNIGMCIEAMNRSEAEEAQAKDDEPEIVEAELVEERGPDDGADN